ncbi:hypothetical protein KIPB_014647, partial [Kipferlia bialata]|eukprot:g14647.t1
MPSSTLAPDTADTLSTYMYLGQSDLVKCLRAAGVEGTPEYE